MKRLIRPLAILATLCSSVAAAVDFSASGFGTAGYTQSNQPFNYQRSINNKGTFERDSIFGVQLDASFSPEWSATVQAKAAPSLTHDDRTDATLPWMFVSWRPTNDWLVRAGKLRIPLYFNSENMDVGTTFDYARLPIEVYSMAPTLDFNGVSTTKSWDVDSGEIHLEGYWGKTRTHWREYSRDTIPGVTTVGPNFTPIDVMAQGLALTYRSLDNDVYRIGLHQTQAKLASGENWFDSPKLVTLMPGVAYYDVRPNAGVTSHETMVSPIINAGLDVGLGNNVRLAAEVAMRRAQNVDRGLSSTGGYVSLRQKIGAWVPYVYYARLRSEPNMLDLYKNISQTTVPAMVPGSSTINLAQRAIADGLSVYDQQTLALGTSYALSATSKLKVEVLHTRVGTASILFDAPAGSDVSGKRVTVFSMSYNFVF